MPTGEGVINDLYSHIWKSRLFERVGASACFPNGYRRSPPPCENIVGFEGFFADPWATRGLVYTITDERKLFLPWAGCYYEDGATW